MTCVRVVVATDELELAYGELWALGPRAIGEDDGTDGMVRLLAGFDDLAAAAYAVSVLRTRWRPTLEAAPDEAGWLDAWRDHAEPVVVGGVRLWPGWWSQAPPAFDGVTVRLDAGRAFGSGSHTSTRQVLDALAGLTAPGARVLDVGCGSGVLAVAAVLLGAASVAAVDLDPEAIRATEANAAANGVTGRVTTAVELPPLDECFDLVLANIGAAVLVDLAAPVAAAVRPGGSLVLGGLLAGQAPAVVAAYVAVGVAYVSTAIDDGWAVVVLRRPGT